MATSNEIKLIITAEVAKAVSELKKLNRETDELGKSTKKSGDGLGGFVSKFGGAIVAVSGLAIGMKKAVDAASDLQETTQKFNVVFKEVQAEANAMAKVLQTTYGMGVEESKRLLAATGDLFTGLGMGQKEALVMSGTIQKLGADLASFSNLEGGAARASDILTKAMLGEREALGSLGVKVSEEMVKTEVAVGKKSKYKGMTELQAKAAATLNIVMAQTKAAHGDVIRSGDTYAATQRKLSSGFADVSAIIGEMLLPAFNAVMQAVLSMINWFKSASEGQRMFIIVAVAVGIAIAVLTKIVMAFGVALSAAIWPVTLIVAAIAAVIAIVVLLRNNWEMLSLGFQLGWEKMKRWFEMGYVAVKIAMMSLLVVMLTIAAAMFAPYLKGINLLITGYNKFATKKIALLDNVLEKGADNLKKEIANDAKRLKNLTNSSKEEFAIFKAYKISETIIATAAAAQAAIASLSIVPIVGPYLGYAMAGLITAMGVRSVAKISAEQPAAFTGGLIPGSPGGTSVTVGERNQSEAIIPLNSDNARRQLGGAMGGGNNITVNIDNYYGENNKIPREIAIEIDKALYDLNRNGGSAFAGAMS